jgi:succinyl-CoA synthetase beta subunit
MVAALTIIQRDPHVRSIFINIFGGITRCDDVARGLVMALARMDKVPKIVVRLTGTNEVEAMAILKDTKLAMAPTMDQGVKMAVEMAR